MIPYVSNDPNQPGFNPNFSAQAQAAAPPRGRRFRNLLYAGFGVGGLGLVLIQIWAFSHRGDVAEAAVDVRPAKAEVPNITFVKPEPPMPPPLPVEAERPSEEHAPVRRAAARRELPTQISFNVKVQEEPDMGWVTDGRRPHLFHGCALRPGASLIPAVLESVIQSEIPGQVIASVSEDVPDADGVGNVLIPQGTKVVGIYRDALTFNSRRIGIIWTEATFPDGTQLRLADANGMDVAGSMGSGGEVDTAWGRLIGVAAVFSVFEAAQRQTVPDGTWGSAVADSSANQFGRLGAEVTKQLLQGAVRIRVPAGTRVTISVGQTLRVC